MDNAAGYSSEYSIRYCLSVAVFFLVGSAACCWMVYHSDFHELIAVNDTLLFQSRGYGSTLLSILWLPALLICARASVFGRFIAWSLAAFRGFMLSSMVSLMQIGIGSEWRVIGYGIFPAFFSTVGFFVLAFESGKRKDSSLKFTGIYFPGILVSFVLLLLAAVIRQLMISF